MHVQSNRRLRLVVLGSVLASVSACGGGGGAGSGGSSSSQFTLLEASNGFGKLLPHQIAVKDAQGQPSSDFVEITRIEQLVDNVTSVNLIRRPPTWPTGAALPNGLEGNQFIFARFSQPLDPTSVLSRSSSQ